MKDYAEQQKRLQDDIKSYLERNQSHSKIKSEEERLYLERTIKDYSKPGRADSFKEPNDTDENSKYIATFDRVKRPMLLVMQENEAQKCLDSPHVNSLINNNKGNSSDCETKVLSTPPSELLLSPQYCNNVKAKKIFTVSRVDSMTRTTIPDIMIRHDNETSNMCDVTLPVTSLSHVTSQNISDTLGGLSSESHQAVNSLINQIVTETLENGANKTSTALATENVMIDEEEKDKKREFLALDFSSVENNNRALETVDECGTLQDCTVGDNIVPNSKYEELCVARHFKEVTETDLLHSASNCENDKTIEQFDQGVAKTMESDSVSEQIGQVVQNLNTMAGKLEIGDTASHSSDIGISITTDHGRKSAITQVGNLSVLVSETKSDREIQISRSEDLNGIVTTTEEIHSHNNSTNSEQISICLSSPAHKLVGMKNNCGPKQGKERDLGVGIYESDHWTTVEAAECLQDGATKQDIKTQINNPDFYSNLSMNGLTQELASALENIEPQDANKASLNNEGKGYTV